MNTRHLYISHSIIHIYHSILLKDVHIYHHYHECSSIFTENNPRHYFSMKSPAVAFVWTEQGLCANRDLCSKQKDCSHTIQLNGKKSWQPH
jgi:hypothetical protein